jgi:hypothetical protein
MNESIIGRHLDVGGALRGYMEKHLDGAVRKCIFGAQELTVIIFRAAQYKLLP